METLDSLAEIIGATLTYTIRILLAVIAWSIATIIIVIVEPLLFARNILQHVIDGGVSIVNLLGVFIIRLDPYRAKDKD